MKNDFYYSSFDSFNKNSINPRMISQAFRDLKLKSPLWWGTSTKEKPASPDINLFKKNTIVFSNTNTISADEMTNDGKLPPQGLVKFTQQSPNTYAIHPISRASNLAPELTVDAYFLGYNGANQSSVKPAYIDIPIQAAENSFLFTGSLTGCSVIVTKHDDTKYRVYHDGRVNSSVLYDNVVMAFDFQDYQVAGTDEGLAMVYMRFNKDQWELVLQRQQYEVIDGIPTPQRRTQDESVILLYPDDAFYQSRLDKFNQYRSDIHQKLFNLAREMNIDTKNFKQGIYTDGDFSLDHQAILSWVELRNKIKKYLNIERGKIDIKIKNARDELIELQDKKNKLPPTEDDGIRMDELKSTIDLNKNLKEYYKQKYDVVLSGSTSVERSWLWLQIKNHHGNAAVVKLDESSIKSGIQSESVRNREKYTVILNKDIWNGKDDFKQGIKHYKELSITGFDEGMSASKMRELYIHGGLRAKERGALSQYIQIKEQSEYIENILNYTLKTNSLFQDGGSIYQRLAPQDFYLPLIGDYEGGRCYPLVRAMSVALVQYDGVSGANELFNKLFIAAASPEEKSSIILRSSLQNLHFNTEAVGASSSIGLLNLKAIKKQLIESNGTQMYALNTQSHSMLIGKKVDNGEVRYCFYDPNFGLYIFDNPKKFSKCLDDFLVKEKMAFKYDALTEKSEPIFDFVSIDIELMANVDVGTGIRVEDLVSSTELSEVIPRRQKTRAFIESQSVLAKDRQIKSSLSILNAEQWGSRLESSLDKVTQKYQLDEYWLPVFASTKRLEDGRYQIQFVHKGNEESSRWIETDDKTFFEFKEYFNESINSFSQHYTFKDLALQHEEHLGGGTETEHVDGLNSAIGIKALIEWAANRNRQSVASGNPSNLDTALKIHAYVSYTMMAHGAVNDMSRVSRLVSVLWKEGSEVVKTEMNSFTSSILHTANEGIGAIFQGVMIGFDIYELANAENEQQRTVIGTQLVFDSAALATSIVGYGASLLGAETVAGVAIPLAVPLTGLGIGITELVNINERHAQEVIEVGVIFGQYKEYYQNAAIYYNEEKKLLMPTEGIVIKEVNFLDANFKLGSEYIYRGEKRTWVFKHSTLSDFQSSPRADINKDKAINIREGVGVLQDKVTFDPTKSNTIALPVIPQCYLRYEYTSLFGGTSRGDYGFSVLRKMEENDQFYFDYFYCGLEYVMSNLKAEYVFTPVLIVLDSTNKHLIVPTLPEPWHGYIEHSLIGAGAEYQISINHGSSLKLKQSLLATEQSTWIIDTSSIDGQKGQVIKVNDDNIQIGNTVVYIDETAASSKILIMNSEHEIREINFNNKTIDLVSINGKHWGPKIDSIQHFLNDLANRNELKRKYVIVNDYSVNGKNVGRAFYDVAARRMLYTNSSNKENQSAILIATIEDIAYFYSESENVIWSSNVNNGGVYAKFDFYDVLGDDSNIERISIKDNTVIVELTNRNRGSEVSVVYHLVKNQLELVSISDDFRLMEKLNKLDVTIPPRKHKDFLNHDYLVNENYIRLSQDNKNTLPTVASPTKPSPKLASIVMIKDTNYLGFQCIYWLRTSDGVLIKPNLARPDDYDQKMIADMSQTLHWFSTNSDELAYMNHRLANGEPFEHVLDLTYVSFTNKWMLSEIEGLFRVANTKPTLLKIVGACFNRFDPLTDTWNWKPPADLILVGSLFDDNGGEVFFFYSKESDTIFRQEGLGQKDIDLKNPTAKRLSIREIDTAFNWNGNILIIQKNGVVKQLNVNGSAYIIAINKTWFENESFNWRNLNDFINEPNPITLFGLKGKDGTRVLPAWYFKGKVIVSESLPSEDTLHFLDFDSSEGCGIIFDIKTKKLYQQTAMSSALLADMFDDNQSLKPSEHLPKLIQLYPDVSLENVRKIGGGLMLSSSEGQLIFHPLSKNEPLGSSFIIKGTNDDDILAPTQLKEAKTLILSGGEGKDTYHLKLEDWQNYRTIIIENQSQDQATDHLVLPISVKGSSIFINRFNDNLILTDSINQTSLVLHNIYGANSLANQHLMIHFNDDIFNLSELANEVTVHRGALYLSSYLEQKPQCNGDLAYLADSCSQITLTNNVSYQQHEQVGLNASSSDIIPINTLQPQIH